MNLITTLTLLNTALNVDQFLNPTVVTKVAETYQSFTDRTSEAVNLMMQLPNLNAAHLDLLNRVISSFPGMLSQAWLIPGDPSQVISCSKTEMLAVIADPTIYFDAYRVVHRARWLQQYPSSEGRPAEYVAEA